MCGGGLEPVGVSSAITVTCTWHLGSTIVIGQGLDLFVSQSLGISSDARPFTTAVRVRVPITGRGNKNANPNNPPIKAINERLCPICNKQYANNPGYGCTCVQSTQSTWTELKSVLIKSQDRAKKRRCV